MTDTITDLDAAAAEAWEWLTREEKDNPMPPFLAVEWVCDRAQCDGGKAVEALCRAAAGALPAFPNRCWVYVPADALNNLRSGSLEWVADGLDVMRRDDVRNYGDYDESQKRKSEEWRPWLTAAERAVAILKLVKGVVGQ